MEANKIPEKEFLLKQGSLICPNMTAILPGKNTEFHPLVNDWLGIQYLVKVDRNYHRPRLRIMYTALSELLAPLGGGDPQILGLAAWDPSCPAVVGQGSAL